MVPGVDVIPVPEKTDRTMWSPIHRAEDGTFKPAAPRAFGPPPAVRGLQRRSQGVDDWKSDKPGRVHRIDLAKLPAPYASPSANNFPRFIEKPADAKLSLPAGFKAEVFVKDLTGPRAMTVAPNGDIFLTETQAGRVKVLRPSADGTTAAVTVFAQGLLQPLGVQFYPAGAQPKWVYIAEMNRVVRYAYQVGATWQPVFRKWS